MKFTPKKKYIYDTNFKPDYLTFEIKQINLKGNWKVKRKLERAREPK